MDRPGGAVKRTENYCIFSLSINSSSRVSSTQLLLFTDVVKKIASLRPLMFCPIRLKLAITLKNYWRGIKERLLEQSHKLYFIRNQAR